MSTIYCEDCGRNLDEHEIRWGHDYRYCEDCFDERYNYCSNCDALIHREDTNWDDDGNPFCDECYSNLNDDDCPDNPDVDTEDIKHVVCLSHNWLKGIKEVNHRLNINRNDFLLTDIREKVGLIKKPLYLYGLLDREEYQIKASPNIYNLVSQYTTLNNWNIKTVEDVGANRLGISKHLREAKRENVINLIKEITFTK